MYSYFKCICLLGIINYTLWTTAAETTDNPECPAGKFNVTPLGHSNLLITWEFDKQDFNPFHFDTKPVGDHLWDMSFERYLFENGWYKITASLKENTPYQIQVRDYSHGFDTHYCNIMAKTNPKKDSFPAKPDFKVSMMNELKQFMGASDGSFQPRVRIEWLPCGKKKFCQADEIAGVDFVVKYGMLNSTQRWVISEHYVPYKYIYGILPGKEYEIIVTSKYGNLVTDSDPQIISIKPVCSSVQSVKIMSLPDSSVFISWKPPKQCSSEKGDFLGYTVFYHVSDNSNLTLLNYSIKEKPYQENLFMIDFESSQGIRYGQSKILNFTVGTSYTFFIIPRFSRNILYGSDYKIDYTPQTYDANIDLAKADFDYDFIGKSYGEEHCDVQILWLPCGQTYDCKNKKPGSYFTVKYREGNGEIQEVTEKSFERTGSYIRLLRHKKYDFWVESVDQSDRVKSDSKEIDTSKCEVNN